MSKQEIEFDFDYHTGEKLAIIRQVFRQLMVEHIQQVIDKVDQEENDFEDGYNLALNEVRKLIVFSCDEENELIIEEMKSMKLDTENECCKKTEDWVRK